MKIQEISNFDIEVIDESGNLIYKGCKQDANSDILNCDIKELNMKKDCILITI